MQDKLNQILLEREWSQGRLAEEFGVSGKALSLWLNGKATPRSKNIDKIEELVRNVKNVKTEGKKVKTESKNDYEKVKV